MDKPGFTPGLRQTIFGALTGQPGDVTGRRDGDLRSQLQAAFGPGRRPGTVNTKAAAQDLGVSQRTVQRWLSGRHDAKPEYRKAIAGRARQAASTQRGRRAAVASARRGPLVRNGAQLKVTGQQGPATDVKYRRMRKVELGLDPEEVNGLLSAYERGGDKAAVAWLEGHADAVYVDDWMFDSITNLELRDPDEP